MLAIRGGRPETLTLRDFIEAFIRFREEVITRRSKFELFKARERAHILLGLVVAVTNLDEVVKLIRGSASPAVAREKLLEREWPMRGNPPLHRARRSGRAAGERARSTGCREAQVKAILELRLHRLTALGRDEIGNELEGLAKNIGELLEILAQPRAPLRGDARGVRRGRSRFATPRVTELAAAADGIEDEDLIEREDMVVTVTLGRLHQAHARSPSSASRSAAARAAPAWRPRRRMRSPSCSSPRPTIRCCSSPTSAASIA